MVDTNIQREDILPSEKAHAYKMKYEALKHQGSRGEKNTADLVGEAAGDSGRTVQRYIRLAYLTDGLLEYVDKGVLPLVAGEKLSYLGMEEQGWVEAAARDGKSLPLAAQAEQMKALSAAGGLTEGKVRELLAKKGRGAGGLTLPGKKLRGYFPDSYTRTQMENVIYALLEQWKSAGEEEA